MVLKDGRNVVSVLDVDFRFSEALVAVRVEDGELPNGDTVKRNIVVEIRDIHEATEEDVLQAEKDSGSSKEILCLRDSEEDEEHWIVASENQMQFVEDAFHGGYDVIPYSGRGMFGAKCPAILVEDVTEFNSESTYQSDNMGLRYVLYAAG